MAQLKSYLIDLYKEKRVNHLSGFSKVAQEIEVLRIVDGYVELRQAAPKRHARDKRYFGDRDGVTSSGGHSKRREEHLAIALVNASREGTSFTLPGAGPLEFIDYQTPLKARRGDLGVGKIDILGVTDGSTLSVIELKIHPPDGSPGDTPLRAYLECLAYCAIADANTLDIAKEVEGRFSYTVLERPPILVVMAPEEYWIRFFDHRRSGDWWPAIERLASQIHAFANVESHFVAIRDCKFDMGLDGNPPTLTGKPQLVSVRSLAAAQKPPPDDAKGLAATRDQLT